MSIGKIYLLISAFVYGIIPLFARGVYAGGSNAVTLIILRSFLALPVLLTVIYFKKISLKLTFREFFKILLLSVVGNAAAMVCLYISYDYISVGMSMVIHYIYPVIVFLACFIFFKEKLTISKTISLLLVSSGIFMFMDSSDSINAYGAAAAFLSGIFYAFYVLYMDKSNIDKMNYLKLTFYVSLFTGIVVLIFSLFTNSLDLTITSQGWILSVIISIFSTIAGMALFQLGVEREGAASAAVISTFEPITSIVTGIIFLNESVTFTGMIGCIFIFAGIIITEIIR